MRRRQMLDPLELLGQGIYTVPEASRLTGISTHRVRRWLRGYDFGSVDRRRHSPPVVEGRMPVMSGVTVLSFLELQELRWVEQFLRYGPTWKTLRAVHAAARTELATAHPFSTGRFVAFGRSIVLRTAQAKGDAALFDLVKSQHMFRQKVLAPFLKSVDIENDQTARWWPLERSHRVVIDPMRSFGQPIVVTRGVPTAILAAAVRAERSIAKVARWYEVDPRAVRDAVRYERKLAA